MHLPVGALLLQGPVDAAKLGDVLLMFRSAAGTPRCGAAAACQCPSLWQRVQQ